MNFELQDAIEILNRTPSAIGSILGNLSEKWVHNNEGEGTWSPYDIVAHLVFAEKTDWIERARIILKDENKNFKPFDRFAHLDESKSLTELIKEFSRLRQENIETLLSYDISNEMLELKGIHPSFGEVTLKQLLSTWVVHDLGHIAQISRVLAKQYKSETGPWIEYLPVLTR